MGQIWGQFKHPLMVKGSSSLFLMAINDGKRWSIGPAAISDGRQAQLNSKQLSTRVARFFMVHDATTGKNVPNEHKMYQIVIKYPKCL
jgi:hypothetical protein